MLGWVGNWRMTLPHGEDARGYCIFYHFSSQILMRKRTKMMLPKKMPQKKKLSLWKDSQFHSASSTEDEGVDRSWAVEGWNGMSHMFTMLNGFFSSLKREEELVTKARYEREAEKGMNFGDVMNACFFQAHIRGFEYHFFIKKYRVA